MSDVKDDILRYRHFLLIHNYLFHIENVRCCSDAAYDKISSDLIKLQNEYPDIAKSVPYSDVFSDWVNHNKLLPLDDPWVVNKATMVSAMGTKKPRKDVEVKKVSKPIIAKKGALF